MKKRNLVFAFAAGLLGGTFSHYLAPQSVHAQSPAWLPKEVRAQSFVLVNEKGQVLGTLSDDKGRPSLRLFDEQGREFWSVGGKIGIRTASLGR